MAVATYSVGIALGTQLTGVFTIGTSTIGSTDVIGSPFSGAVFTEVGPAAAGGIVRDIHIMFGRPSDMQVMGQGTCVVTVQDVPGRLTGVPIGQFNPEGGYKTAVIADAPVAYWRLDEASGAAANDSSGSANNGAIIGGVTLGRAGGLNDANTAMQFDGSTGYINVADAAVLRIIGDITLECWVNIPSASLSGENAILGKDAASPTYAAPYWFDVNNGQMRLARGNNAGQTIVVSDGAISAASWQHLAVTQQGNTVTFYLNGAKFGTTKSMVGQSIADAGQALTLGRQGAGVSQWMNGVLDEVAIYNTALSAARIQAHYDAQLCYGGLLVPMRPVRVQATYSGVTYGLFYGFVSRIEYDAYPTDPKAIIEVVDLFEWLAAAMPVIGTQVGQTVSQIITTILSAIGLTDPSFLDIATGGDTIPSWTAADGTKTALQLIQDLLTTDLGVFHIAGSGKATYRTRQTRYSAASSVTTLTGALLTGMKSTTDKQLIFNAALATRQYSQQTVTITGSPTGGTFTLTLDGQTTGPINYNDTAGTVATALQALSNVGTAGVTTTGGPFPGTAVVCNFTGQRLAMTATSGLTGGTSPAIAVAATVVSSAAQLATNSASQGLYARRSAPAVASANWATDGAALSFGRFITSLNGTPRPPGREIQVENFSDATMTQILARQLLDVVTVSAAQGGSQFSGSIQAISHHISRGGIEHVAQFVVQQGTLNVFTIGQSTIGGPDVFGY